MPKHLYSADDLSRVLVTEAQIERRVAELGEQITGDYLGHNLSAIGILKGSFVFLSDLLRHIDLPLIVDFVAISSYGQSTKSSGVVRINMDLDQPIATRDVLIVEDIVDTGLTLRYLIDYLRRRSPASIKVCALLDKPARRETDIVLDYVGFTIPDEFVVGYGLDYSEQYRNLPFVGALKQSVYSK